jgi:hypothetical protein
MTQPQPLSAFPVLQRLAMYDRWLAHPDIRAERMWEADGWDGRRYTFFNVRNGTPHTLGMLMREGKPHYWRLYPSYAVAVRDGNAWSHEIHAEPDKDLIYTGGLDKNGKSWSLRLVQRPAHWELHTTRGCIIPAVRDFMSQEDAEMAADEWLTDFHESEDEIEGHVEDEVEVENQ